MLRLPRAKVGQVVSRRNRQGLVPEIQPDPFGVFSKLAGSDSSESSDLVDVALSEPTANTDIHRTFPPAQDPLLHYLTSKLTHCGRRHRAAHRVSRMLMHIHGYTGAHPLPILRQAIFSVSPAVRVAMHKKGVKSVAMPMPLNEKQRTRFGVEWILQASEKKPGKAVEVRLAQEMIAVVEGTSEALKKKQETHRHAMLNRANAVRSRGGK